MACTRIGFWTGPWQQKMRVMVRVVVVVVVVMVEEVEK